MKRVLDKSDIRKVYRGLFFSQASWSYERMQALGFATSVAPALEKIYKDDKEGLSEALVRHTEFFNTCPTYGIPPIMGIVVALEEQKADPELIRGVKAGMMGPLAGIGDTIIWAILGPLLFSIPASMALEGSISSAYIALLVTQVIFIGWSFIVRWKLLNLGYEQGTEVATSSANVLEQITFGAGVLGLIVVGALAPGLVSVSTPLSWDIGGLEFVLQDVLNSLLPSLIPLLFVLGILYLIKAKNMSTTKIVLILFVVCMVLGAFGIII